jgi:hypothetical protein
MRRRALLPLALTAVVGTLALSLPAGAAATPLSFRRTVLQDQEQYGEPSLAIT